MTDEVSDLRGPPQRDLGLGQAPVAVMQERQQAILRSDRRPCWGRGHRDLLRGDVERLMINLGEAIATC
jgi:hypothetical protein